ncbi:MAG: glutamate-5-semialdehyde dehydrogenase [Bacteroidales bacterium]
MLNILPQVRSASRSLNFLTDTEVNQILLSLADCILDNSNFLIAENGKDLAKMEQENPLFDRLLLNQERIEGIAKDIQNVASLASPVGVVLAQNTRPNGMRLTKLTVPFGVVGVIYEARPNVTLDVFSLCFKSGNACVLKGGSDAQHSNIAAVSLIHQVLQKYNVDPMVVQLLPASRASTNDLLNAVGLVDLIIPRGSESLIQFVRDNARIPVIETGTGVCHIYIDEFADVHKAKGIITNAKTRRVSVCNAAECMVMHAVQLPNLSEICSDLAHKNVQLYVDDKAFVVLQNHYPSHLLHKATAEDFGKEFIDYKLAIKTVDSIEQAIEFINTHGTMHSECIVSENAERITLFQKMIDAACVYANVSTAFTDGAQFGLGAEIGISTQKMHARGPMSLAELCSYKWLIEGEGQVRE